MKRYLAERPARIAPVLALTVTSLFSHAVSGALSQEAQFRVKPSEVVIPPGAVLGSYRRIVQPFENWTLICDEDLRKLRKICNVQQDIISPTGVVVFSWSLAATEDGRPMMMLRGPAGIGKGNKVTLGFEGSKTYAVAMESCDENGCGGMAPVGPQIKSHIGNGLAIAVSYHVPGFGEVSLSAPMKGLSEALSAIQ